MFTEADLLARIDRFLTRKGMSETAFGTKALKDPNFVFDLRAGKRSIQLKTAQKVNDFMRTYRAERARV